MNRFVLPLSLVVVAIPIGFWFLSRAEDPPLDNGPIPSSTNPLDARPLRLPGGKACELDLASSPASAIAGVPAEAALGIGPVYVAFKRSRGS